MDDRIQRTARKPGSWRSVKVRGIEKHASQQKEKRRKSECFCCPEIKEKNIGGQEPRPVSGDPTGRNRDRALVLTRGEEYESPRKRHQDDQAGCVRKLGKTRWKKSNIRNVGAPCEKTHRRAQNSALIWIWRNRKGRETAPNGRGKKKGQERSHAHTSWHKKRVGQRNDMGGSLSLSPAKRKGISLYLRK